MQVGFPESQDAQGESVHSHGPPYPKGFTGLGNPRLTPGRGWFHACVPKGRKEFPFVNKKTHTHTCTHTRTKGRISAAFPVQRRRVSQAYQLTFRSLHVCPGNSSLFVHCICPVKPVRRALISRFNNGSHVCAEARYQMSTTHQ